MEEGETQVQVQGMTLPCPPDWRDKSMLVLTAAQAGTTGVTPTLVITREEFGGDPPLGSDTRLERFVDRQLDQMRISLAGLEEISRRAVEPAGALVELTIAWASDGIPVMQRVTFADIGENTVMIATATAGRADFPEKEAQFAAMLKSFRIS